MPNPTLIDLAERCERASEADRELDIDIGRIDCGRAADGPDCPDFVRTAEFSQLVEALGSDGAWNDCRECGQYVSARYVIYCPKYTKSLNAAVAFVRRNLPGWWWTCGLCGLTGHASIGPDYNGPDRERLLKEWPLEQGEHIYHADLAPGDGVHRVCLALLSCALRALAEKENGDG